MSKPNATELDETLADLTHLVGEKDATQALRDIIVARMATAYSEKSERNAARRASQANKRRAQSTSTLEPAFSKSRTGVHRQQVRLHQLIFDEDDPRTFGAPTAKSTELKNALKQRRLYAETRDDPNDFEHARNCPFCGGIGHDGPHCNPEWTLPFKKAWLADSSKKSVHCQRCGGRFHGIGDHTAKGTETWCPSLTRQQHAAERAPVAEE
jgi:hypothetical protein